MQTGKTQFLQFALLRGTFLMRCMSDHGLDTHSSPRLPTGVCVHYSPLHSLTALPAGSVSPFPLRLSPRNPRLIHLYAFPPRTHSLIHSSQRSADGEQEKEDDGRKKKKDRSLSFSLWILHMCRCGVVTDSRWLNLTFTVNYHCVVLMCHVLIGC